MEEPLHPAQIQALRRLSPERRLQLAMEFMRSGRRLKRTGLRLQHPEWSEEQIAREMRRLTLYGA